MSTADTGSVFDTYLDAAVARTSGPQAELAELATASPATVNTLTKQERPTQSIADLCALRDHFGVDDARQRLAYLGLINNTARALVQLVSLRVGMRLDVYSPDGHGLSAAEVLTLNQLAGRGAVRQLDSVPDSPVPVDGVNTCRWPVGRSEPDGTERAWEAALRPFAVSRDSLRRFGDGNEGRVPARPSGNPRPGGQLGGPRRQDPMVGRSITRLRRSPQHCCGHSTPAPRLSEPTDNVVEGDTYARRDPCHR